MRLFLAVNLALILVTANGAPPLVNRSEDIEETTEIIITAPGPTTQEPSISIAPTNCTGLKKSSVIQNLTTESNAEILCQYQEINQDGTYKFGFESSNGIKVQETGSQKEIEGPTEEKTSGTASSGSYSYLFEQGGKTKRMTVVWTADERGFLPRVTVTDV